MSTISDYDYYSIDEVEKLLEDLSDEDVLRLDEWSMDYCVGLSIVTPENIFDEAINKVLAGDRRMPKGEDLMFCLKNAMRSIANNYRKKEERMLMLLRNDDGRHLTPEEVLVCEENEKQRKSLYDDLWDKFSDDENVMEIFLGWENGLKGRDLREFYGMTKTEYDSALKKINRRLKKYYPNGRQS